MLIRRVGNPQYSPLRAAWKTRVESEGISSKISSQDFEGGHRLLSGAQAGRFKQRGTGGERTHFKASCPKARMGVFDICALECFETGAKRKNNDGWEGILALGTLSG